MRTEDKWGFEQTGGREMNRRIGSFKKGYLLAITLALMTAGTLSAQCETAVTEMVRSSYVDFMNQGLIFPKLKLNKDQKKALLEASEKEANRVMKEYVLLMAGGQCPFGAIMAKKYNGKMIENMIVHAELTVFLQLPMKKQIEEILDEKQFGIWSESIELLRGFSQKSRSLMGKKDPKSKKELKEVYASALADLKKSLSGKA
ncbi:MAG: hypothetical protein HQL31_01495 [Planctomycetes bacterium]|nr:hypothetical protein [Planctomycetota bacterium]